MMPQHLPKTSRRAFLGGAILVAAVAKVPKLNGQTGSGGDPFAALPASAWNNPRQNGLVMIWRNPPPVIARAASIAAGGEPGRRLVVMGQVFAPDGTTPAPDVTVYAYQTDAEGYYGADHAGYPPRLHGWMKTDRSGSFELSTISPGHYPNMRIPAHTHFSVWGGGYPLQWVDELRFEGDRFITPAMAAEAAAQGAFSTIRPVTQGKDGASRCTFKIRLQNECNFR